MKQRFIKSFYFKQLHNIGRIVKSCVWFKPLIFQQPHKGKLHSDKYGAYEKLANKENISWCPCFAHIRRYFLEAKGGDQKFCQYVLMKIRHLYMLERKEHYLLKSKYQKALTCFSRLIPYLKNYLSDPDAQIDNNMAARAIRPLAIGRIDFFVNEKG